MSEIKIIAVIGKLRPRVKPGRLVDMDDLADEIAAQSGFDRGDARDFAFKFARALVGHLRIGDYVKMAEMGSFYLSCDKDKKLKVAYRASRDVNDWIARDFRGEFINGGNAGLDDEGYARRWLELHPGDTVVMRDGSTRTL